MLRFAVVTDIHYGFNRGYRLGSHAPEAMRDFIEAVNNYNPDCIVEMGDRINAVSPVEDLKWLTELQQHFNQAAAPVYSVLGNNDIRYLTEMQNEALTGCPVSSYAKDISGHRLLFWNPDVNTDKDGGLILDDSHLGWLETMVATTDDPVVIFSHIPLHNTQKDNEETAMWGKSPYQFYYPEAERIREVIENAGNVVLCMAGHIHTNIHRHNGNTHYITHQSLVQADHTRADEDIRYAFSFVEIDDDNINIIGHGKGQPNYTLPVVRKP